ncbi:MAG: ABC transporter permease [Candidatus Coatesbacteria bacterium]|nr:MAG: ABC transporter permease [Candidatus Coatesbacteria bacterium]
MFLLLWFERFGRVIIYLLNDIGGTTILFAKAVYYAFTPPFKLRRIVDQMVRIGVDSVPVVILTAVFTGMVLAMQATYQIAKFGADIYIGGIVGISMTRELGPVLTALMVSGRVGAAIAAEIGTMKVTEQIDALETLATNPVQYLVMPRVVAAAVMLPTLTAMADFVGIAGGYGVSTTLLGINPQAYIEKMNLLVHVSDLFIGLLKTVVFGIIIASVACNQGFKASGGAEGVGRATTVSVVTSCILILLSDVFLTGLFVGSHY